MSCACWLMMEKKRKEGNEKSSIEKDLHLQEEPEKKEAFHPWTHKEARKFCHAITFRVGDMSWGEGTVLCGLTLKFKTGSADNLQLLWKGNTPTSSGWHNVITCERCKSCIRSLRKNPPANSRDTVGDYEI